MKEPGWPLIPREGLPAPVPAAKRRLPPRPSPPPSGQLPFFGAATTEPSPADLAGLLAGPGRLGRMGGTARVTVPVDAAWRVHVLVAELVSRGLVVTWRPFPVRLDDPADFAGIDPTDLSPRDSPIKSDISGEYDEQPETPVGDVEHDEHETRRASSERNDADESGAGDAPRIESDDGNTESDDESTGENDEVPSGPRFEVLTAYSRRLNGLANFWTGAATQLFLSGPRLRLWVAAAGEPVTGGYALGLDPAKDVVMIDAALVRAGLAGRVAADRSRYLIMGKRRLRRLAELVGDRPEAAPEHLWPGAAGA
ncbi:hypothetical protein [Actinoplanes sp. TBRC 11911]|uniref:hypothetical protein n=1 Tax=Actinoplanes sp. TBRC 11911 TaxID=2729386 RepID=UPI0037BEF408